MKKFKSLEEGKEILESVIDPLAEEQKITSKNIPYLIELFNNRETEDGWNLKFSLTRKTDFDEVKIDYKTTWTKISE